MSALSQLSHLAITTISNLVTLQSSSAWPDQTKKPQLIITDGLATWYQENSPDLDSETIVEDITLRNLRSSKVTIYGYLERWRDAGFYKNNPNDDLRFDTNNIFVFSHWWSVLLSFKTDLPFFRNITLRIVVDDPPVKNTIRKTEFQGISDRD